MIIRERERGERGGRDRQTDRHTDREKEDVILKKKRESSTDKKTERGKTEVITKTL